MADPLLEEFARAPGSLRPDFFRRVQRHIRDVINPQLDERDRLLEENAQLRADLDKSKKRGKASEAAA